MKIGFVKIVKTGKMESLREKVKHIKQRDFRQSQRDKKRAFLLANERD